MRELKGSYVGKFMGTFRHPVDVFCFFYGSEAAITFSTPDRLLTNQADREMEKRGYRKTHSEMREKPNGKTYWHYYYEKSIKIAVPRAV